MQAQTKKKPSEFYYVSFNLLLLLLHYDYTMRSVPSGAHSNNLKFTKTPKPINARRI